MNPPYGRETHKWMNKLADHENGERAKANSGAPSVLVGYGDEADKRLKECGIIGTYLNLKQQKKVGHCQHRRSFPICTGVVKSVKSPTPCDFM
jgi:hypothetical protein